MLGKVKRPAPLLVASTLALGIGIFLVARRPGAPPPLPAGALAEAVTLPDGFRIEEGSVSLGPPVVESLDEAQRPLEWFAVLAVTEDPVDTWDRYVRQAAQLSAASGLGTLSSAGCRRDSEDGFVCDVVLPLKDGGRVEMRMDSVPGDVTGRYVVVVEVSRDGLFPDSSLRRPPEGPDRAAEPEKARRPVEPGAPLAPQTAAYPGDRGRYVLLPGSELIAQWGPGSLTGGFSVLVRVLPSSDIASVAAAYVQQASQFEGEVETRRLTFDDVNYEVFRPPGGAGGYSGTIWAVDRPGRENDYIYYSLLND